MTTTMTIGAFSRATRLSAKALRFYHQAGLLEPAWIDPVNGYRVYASEQIADAQVVRHFRALDMPVEVIREVLASSDIAVRNQLIARHLERMEAQLEQTRSAVAGLRGLIAPARTPFAVEHRSLPATPVYVIRETIDLADLSGWYSDARHELTQAVATTQAAADGPLGGLWDTELFLQERGPAVLFRPVRSTAGLPASIGRAHVDLLPAIDLAVARHVGTDDTIGQVYGALAAYVTEHELGVDGPLRESYVQEAGLDGVEITEIGWPIFRTGR